MAQTREAFGSLHRGEAWAVWAAILVFLIGAAIRLFYFGGVVGADDLSIANHALGLLEDGFKVPTSHYSARVGLIYPLAGVFHLFGVGEWQLVVLPFAFSLIGLLLAYAIGAEIAGVEAGLFALVLLAVFPLDVMDATHLFPDLPLGVTIAAAIYLALRSRRANAPYLWCALSGLLWGYAYLIKIEAVFLGPAMLTLLLLDRGNWRRYVFIMAVCGAVIVAENVVYFLLTDEILYRIKVIDRTTSVISEEYSQAQLWVFPKAWFVTVYEFGIHYYLLVVSAVWAVAARRGYTLLVVVWIAVYLVWLQFGGNPFAENFRYKTHLLRYCNQIGVPMAVLCGAFLAHLGEVGWRRLANGSLAATAVVAVFFVNFNTLGGERETAVKIALRKAVAENWFPLYLDTGSYDIADFLLHDRGVDRKIVNIQHHDFTTAETEIADLGALRGYLLVSRDLMRARARRYFMKGLGLEATRARYDRVFVVDNPMGALAYWQVRLLIGVAELLPSEFLRRKIAQTGEEILAPEDAEIFILPGAGAPTGTAPTGTAPTGTAPTGTGPGEPGPPKS